MRTVFSIDLIRTLAFGVMGELASLRGLKFITAFSMRLEVVGLVLMRMERVLRVASTSSASLVVPGQDSKLVPQRESYKAGQGEVNVPAVLLEKAQHPVQKTHSLWLKVAGIK